MMLAVNDTTSLSAKNITSNTVTTDLTPFTISVQLSFIQINTCMQIAYSQSGPKLYSSKATPLVNFHHRQVEIFIDSSNRYAVLQKKTKYIYSMPLYMLSHFLVIGPKSLQCNLSTVSTPLDENKLQDFSSPILEFSRCFLLSTEVTIMQYSHYSVKTSVNRLIVPQIPGLTQNSRSLPA